MCLCSGVDSGLALPQIIYYVKSVSIRNLSGPYFPAFGLNMERCGVYIRIQSKS